jgi:hypothetical protein
MKKRATWQQVAIGATVLGMAGAGAAQAQTYNGTVYVAAMGGHFAQAEVTIDPSKAQPIIVRNLTKIDIGDSASHPVHDARIDANDRNTMFWSTYKADPGTGKLHIGKTDLRTGEKTADIDVDIPAGIQKTGSMYCASGQTRDHFLPISMSNKGYIDVFRKADLKLEQRIFLEGTAADIGKPYKFYHGNTTPDLKKMVVTINEAETDHGKTIGKMHLVMLDAEALTKGNVKVLQKGLATGEEKTVSFRQYFSHDGKLLANASGDRLLLIDAATLETLDAELSGKLEETHDAIFTPDDRYVIATMRTKIPGADCKDRTNPGPDEFIMDGQLKLYDVKARKFIGEPTSVCNACHTGAGVDQHAILCGLDANWK